MNVVNEYITENYTDIRGWLKNVTKGERPDLFEDFFHDTLITFMEHPSAPSVIEDGGVRWFLVRIGLNNWRSNTSPHYKKYKTPFLELFENLNYYDEELYDFDLDIEIQRVLNILDDMLENGGDDKYYSFLILMYVSLKCNLSEVGRRFNIERNTIHQHYQKALKRFKKLHDEKRGEDITINNNKTLKILTTKILKDYGKENIQ